MKKNYIQPELRIVFIKGTTILSGSSGNEIETGESNATINITNTDDYNGEFFSRQGHSSIWDDEE